MELLFNYFGYTIFLFILPVVAWRITHLLIEEDGPFNIFYRFRTFTNGTKFLKEIFTCFYCLSVWVGLFLSLILLPIEFALLGCFYLSGAAILLEKVVK